MQGMGQGPGGVSQRFRAILGLKKGRQGGARANSLALVPFWVTAAP